jgi:hypothetical protein
MTIREVWMQFLGYLTGQGASPVVVLAVAIAVALSLVGGAALVWLAFTVKKPPPESPPDNVA